MLKTSRWLLDRCGARRVAVRARESGKGGWEALEVRLEDPAPASAGPAEVEGWIRGWSEFLRRGGIRGEAIVCLPEEWVTLRGVPAPEVAEAAQDDVNRFEAVQALTPPVGEWVWDCEGCGAADGKVEVLVASAPLRAVDALVQTFEDAGCVLRRVLPPSVALGVGFAEISPEGTLGVAIGEADLTFVVASGRRRVIRSRRLGRTGARAAEPGPPASVAGTTLEAVGTADKTIRLRRPPPEAGIAAGSAAAGGLRVSAEAGDGLGERTGLTAEDLGWLQLEAARALARLRGSTARPEVLVAGDAPEAALEAIGGRLRLPVRGVTPLEPGRGLPPELGGAAAVRLAGALRLLDEKAPRAAGICLLPGPRRRSLAWRRRQAVAAGFAAAAALTLLPPAAVQAWRTDEARRRADGAEDRVRRMSELAEANRRLAGRIEAAETERSRMDMLIAERSRWTGLLADLQAGVGAVEGAWLESVQLVRDPGGRREAAEASYRVIGHILEGPGASESRLRLLLGAVVRSPWVARLEHERFQRRDDGRLRFEVQVALAGEPKAAGGVP